MVGIVGEGEGLEFYYVALAGSKRLGSDPVSRINAPSNHVYLSNAATQSYLCPTAMLNSVLVGLVGAICPTTYDFDRNE